MKLLKIIIFILSISVSAQTNSTLFGSVGGIQGTSSGHTTLTYTSSGRHGKGVKGYPMLYKKYKKGIIELKDKRVFNINKLNIDLEKGFFFTELDDSSIFIFKNLDNLKIGASNFFNKGNMIFERLDNDANVNLNFIKHISKYKRSSSPDRLNPFGLTIWKSKKEYYLILKDERIKVKLKKKSILSSLPKDVAEAFLIYSKTNRLSFKKEKDVIKMVNHYNSI